MKVCRSALITTFIFLNSLGVVASPLPEFPFVTVSAEAEKEVPPDKVTIRFSVKTFDEKSESAVNQLKLTSANLAEFLLSQGIDKSDIEAFSITKNARRKRDRNYSESNIIGYDVVQEFTVELVELDKYEAVVNKLLNTDYVQGMQYEFDVSNREEIEGNLIAKAGKKAKLRADQLAKGMGTELSGVQGISESGSFNEFFASHGLATGFDMPMLQLARETESSNSVFIPQTITIKKSINVIFRISQF